MKTILDVVAIWTTLNVVLIAAWHLAHVRSRRLGTRVLMAGSASPSATPTPSATPSATATQRVYTLAPETPRRETGPALVQAGRD